MLEKSIRYSLCWTVLIRVVRAILWILMLRVDKRKRRKLLKSEVERKSGGINILKTFWMWEVTHDSCRDFWIICIQLWQSQFNFVRKLYSHLNGKLNRKIKPRLSHLYKFRGLNSFIVFLDISELLEKPVIDTFLESGKWILDWAILARKIVYHTCSLVTKAYTLSECISEC